MRTVVLAAALVVLSASGAGAAVPAEGPYDGTWDNHWSPEPPPSTFTGSTVTIGGVFRYIPEPERTITRITFDVIPRSPGAGCPTDPTSAPPVSNPPVAGDGTVPFAFSVVPPCNGRYDIVATATATAPILWPPVSASLMIADAVVALQPPPVTDLRVTVASNRAVSISWALPVNYAPPPDFAGYRVVRIPSGRPAQTISEVGPTARSATDANPPGGRVTYRVYSRRSSPAGAVESSTTEGAVTVPGTGAGSTTPGQPGNPGRSPGTPPGDAGGSLGGGVPTTMTLPADRPQPPGGDDDFFDAERADTRRPVGAANEGPGGLARDMLLPLAAGLVLLVWSLHSRTLVKAARPGASTS